MATQLVFTTTKDGLQTFLEYSLGKATPADFKVHSYSNDVVISEALVLGDLTENIDYSTVILTSGNWTVSYTTKGLATYGISIEMPFTSEEISYGCYITDATSSELIGISKFDSHITIKSSDTLVIETMIFTLDN